MKMTVREHGLEGNVEETGDVITGLGEVEKEI